MISAIEARQITEAYIKEEKAKEAALKFCEETINGIIIENADSGSRNAFAQTTKGTAGTSYIAHIVKYLMDNDYDVNTSSTQDGEVIISVKW